MKVIQVNLHHSRAASASLTKTFTLGKFDLALIQEPWISKGRVAGLADAKGRLIYCKQSHNARTCILVKRGIQCFPLVEFCSRDLTTILIQGNGGRRGTLYSSAYQPYDPKELPPTRELESMVEHAAAERFRLLVGCDSNAHHIEGWGSSNTNRRGESFLDFLLVNNLQVANVGGLPTFANRLREEVIDVTFCCQYMMDQVREWHVSKEASLSDHRYIIFKVGCPKEVNQFRNPRRTDWVGYASLLDSLTVSLKGKIRTPGDLEQGASSLNEAIIISFHESCPLQTRQKSISIRWWTQDLARKRSKIRQLYNQCRVSRNWGAYHQALTSYTIAIKKAKRASWRKYTQEVNNLKEAARLQKVLAANPINPVGSLLRSDGSYTNSPRETLDLLLKTHFPGCIERDNLQGGPGYEYVVTRPRAAKADWDLARRVVTFSKMSWAIDKFSPFKSPGADGIFPALLQNAPRSVRVLVCELLRASLALGHIPSAWSVSKVVFIPKRGRTDHSKAKSFRPISLSSFILKTLERLVDRYLRDGVLLGQPLHRKQHAFQDGKSCMSALNDLVSRAEESLESKEIALCAFLDIEGAFDNVSHAAIGRAVSGRGTPPVICRWVDVLLGGRSVRASLMEETIEVSTVRGCPQGGVLSPLLWNMVIDSLLTQITVTGAHIQGFADDIAIMVRGKFVETVVEIMNARLKEVCAWCNREGLRVNPEKTTILPISRLRNLTALSRLEMNGSKLRVSVTAKFLGVTLDQRLTWNPHLENVLHKAKWALMTSRRLVGSNWGLRPQVVHWLYKMVILPQILYGAIVWWPKAVQRVASQQLASLQRMACLCISGAFTSTPTAALEVLLGLLPLDLAIKTEAIKTAYRLASFGYLREGHSAKGHTKVLRTGGFTHLLEMAPDVMKRKFVFARPFEIDFETSTKWNSKKVPHGAGIVWYTDGSVMGGKAGFGVYGNRPKTAISCSLGEYCTIFQAEVIAILECAYLGLNKGFRGTRITILSDSQAALGALSSCVMSSRLVWECYNALCALSRLNTVSLGWVPGHRGIEGNERADKLAKEGAMTPFTGPEPGCGISWAMVRGAIHKWAHKEHTSRWGETEGQVLPKSLVGEPSTSLSAFLLRLDRVNLRQVLAYFTGHGQFRHHLAKLGLYQGDTSCRLCGQSPETAAHLLRDCEPLESRRRGIFGGPVPGAEPRSCIGDHMLKLAKSIGNL